MEQVILSNGLVIGNLSSPHDFNFEDGSILKGVDAETTGKFSVRCNDIFTAKGKYIRVAKTFEISENFFNKLQAENDNFQGDIILVPFMLITALRENDLSIPEKFHTIFVPDGLKKLVSIDKFCK